VYEEEELPAGEETTQAEAPPPAQEDPLAQLGNDILTAAAPARQDPLAQLGGDILAESQKSDPSSQTGEGQAPPPGQEEKTEPESQFAAGARSVAHSVIPSVAGAVGVGVGGVLVNLPGALIGGMAFGGAAHQAQEWLLKNLFGFDDSKIQAANREAHPWTTGFGEVLGAAPSFGVTAAPMVASRLANAAITGAIDYAAGGDIQHAAGAALGGAALGNPTTLGKAAIEGGENVGKKISSLLATGKATSEEAGNILSAKGATVDGAATKPESAGDYPPGNPADASKPGAEVDEASVKTPGISTPGGYGGRAATKPNEDVAIGNPGSKPTQSERDYGVDAVPPGEANIASGRVPAPLGTMATDVEAVLRPKPEEPAVPAERPVQQAEQEQPGAPAPRAAAADRTMDLIKSLQDESNARAAAKENPPSEFDQAAQKAVDAAQKSPYKNTGKQARQQDEPITGGPPREPPKPPGEPPEPPEPGPKDARLANPPLLESKGGGPFNALRRTFAPEFMSPASEKAAAALRRGGGIMEDLNKKWTHTLEKHFPAMEKLIKNGEMEAFTDKVEGGNHFPEYTIPKELEGAAADIKEMYKAYKEKAAEISKDPEAVRAWNDNYVTHIYKDEPKSFWDRVGGGGVRGSGGSLKARKYNTYAEAKEAEGHEPRHKNILNTAEAYRTEIGKHIATEMAKQEMREGGHLKYAMPEQRVGASGQMGSLKEGTRIHPDWEPVENMSMGGRQAYMPRDAANVFNNHLSPGLKGNKYIAPFYEAWREAANRFTASELGLFNGFHTFVTGGESVLSNQARGVSELSKSAKYALQGNLKDSGIELTAAGKSILTSPAAPVANYHAGRRFMAIAEGNDKPWSVFSPIRKFKQPTETEKLMTKASAEAGVMPHGRSYAPDENLSKMGTYTQSYMRGQFGREMSEMAQRIKDNPFKGVPVEAWNMIGRSLQTMSEPLFGHYIPALKYGTLMKDLESFMRQGKVDMRTPQGYEAAVKFLRKQGNAMDVRVGEANANNMFMNKSIQQAGYGLLRSFSWARGTGIAILGGPGAVAKTVGEGVVHKDMGAAMRKLANKLDMNHKDYDPNLTYSIAFPFGTALIASVYQLYKTGELPSSFKDLYLPRTGGLVPGVGGKGSVEERVPLPGYHKEIRGAIHDPVAEVMNKRNTLITTLGEQATGKDWKDQPIVRPDATLAENLTDRAKHLQSKLLNPLMLKNVTATPPEGSKISMPERVLGFKGAGKAYIDPEKTEKGAAARYNKAWDSSKNQEYKEQHGGRANMPKSELKATYGTTPKPSTLNKDPLADLGNEIMRGAGR
jgi:hypothetical protein